jgi:hypothetical protein
MLTVVIVGTMLKQYESLLLLAHIVAFDTTVEFVPLVALLTSTPVV